MFQSFLEPNCSNGADSYYLYPFDCSKLTVCTQKQSYLMTCPDGYKWNHTLEACHKEENVDCCKYLFIYFYFIFKYETIEKYA